MRAVGRWFVAVLLVASPTPGHSQVQLLGRVIENSSEQAIAAAMVTLQDPTGRALGQRITDEGGMFSFAVEHRGPVRLKVEHIGYETVVTPALELAGYSSYRVEIRMDAHGIVLAPLEVVARDRGPTLAAFDRRRQSGIGWYITREEIQRRGVAAVTDILAMAPGVWLQRSGRSGRMPYIRADCPAQIYVDGFLLNRGGGRGRRGGDVGLDDILKPSAIEGIEVYQGLSKPPPEYMTPDARCGVILIWTRRGPS